MSDGVLAESSAVGEVVSGVQSGARSGAVSRGYSVSGLQVQRLPLVDWIKALAAQLIVLHHMALYGPLAHVAAQRWPDPMIWLFDYGLYAVQAFLVVGGYLAVRGLAPQGRLVTHAPFVTLIRRYQRLVLPFAVALLLAIAAALLAGHWMQHESVTELGTAKETGWRFLMHLLLLHNVLEVDALSAGVWYVAIDFQLFALMLGVLWLAERAHRLGRFPWAEIFTFVAVTAALLVFNRNADLDAWGIYFMGSYGLGALAYWLSRRDNGNYWLALLSVTVLLALQIEFRERIALALSVALLLALVGRREDWLVRLRSRTIAFLSKISYAVFLVHFPVALVVNAFFMHFLHPGPVLALVGVGLAWALSLLVGVLFERYVETPLRG